jgi:HK97 family phage major capsid protein
MSAEFKAEKVAAPQNEAEAKAIHEELMSLASETDKFISENEQNWNAEIDAQYQARHAREQGLSEALEVFNKNREQAAARREELNSRVEGYDFVSSLGGSSDVRRKAVEAERTFADAAASLNDRDLCDAAVVARVLQAAGCDLDASHHAAIQANIQHTASVCRDAEMRRGKGFLVDTVGTDVVRAIQSAQKRGQDVRAALSTSSPSSTSTGSGSQLFNNDFMTRIEAARLAYGGVLSVADVIVTESGESIVWPTIDDTSNAGALVAEAAGPVSYVDPSFDEKVWGAYKYGSTGIKFSYEFATDNQVGFVGMIADLLGERLGRIENSVLTSGDGSNKPTGIVTACPAGPTAAANNAISYDELITLEHSVDPARRRDAKGYMFNDNTLLLLRLLKDGDQRPLWQPGVNVGAPSTLNTYSYTINQDMDGFDGSASLKPVIFGDLSAYKVRRVRGMRLVVTDELYAESDQVGMFAWIRFDGNLLNAGDDPIKAIVTPA